MFALVFIQLSTEAAIISTTTTKTRTVKTNENVNEALEQSHLYFYIHFFKCQMFTYFLPMFSVFCFFFHELMYYIQFLFFSLEHNWSIKIMIIVFEINSNAVKFSGKNMSMLYVVCEMTKKKKESFASC